MERSFGRSVIYGYGRARWRRLWRVRIQEYFIAAIQNIQILIKYGANPRKAVEVARVNDNLYCNISINYEKIKKSLLDSILMLKVIAFNNLITKTY